MPMLQIDGQDLAEVDSMTAFVLWEAASHGRGRLTQTEAPGFLRQIPTDHDAARPCRPVSLELEFPVPPST